jgi:AmiR/NasT family two-component response regulator
VIEQAKGVLVGRYGVDTTTAFETLRSAARSNRLGIHDLARRIVEETETPQEIVARLPREAREEARGPTEP